ncbi:hypothetical protein [Tropicimonas aquimaris]|uniref:Uncharacterized protein n=1 Tax=Tropicimonas aquimaris TaxID=914152 RepID=A0ABW3IX63_9RHOB
MKQLFENVGSSAARALGCGIAISHLFAAGIAPAAPSTSTTCSARNTISAYNDLLNLYAASDDPDEQAVIEQAANNLNTCCSSLNHGQQQNNCLCSPGPYDLVSPIATSGNCNRPYVY